MVEEVRAKCLVNFPKIVVKHPKLTQILATSSDESQNVTNGWKAHFIP